MEQRYVEIRGASRGKSAVGIRFDDRWRVRRCPSYGHSDHLDLFLTAPRHGDVAAFLLFALIGPAFSGNLIGPLLLA